MPEELDEDTQPDDPPTFGKNNRDMPEDMRNKLEGIIKKLQGRETYDRIIEILTDRILRFYEDGVQHVYPNWGTGVYQIGTAGGVVDIGNGQSAQCPLFMGAWNIFRSRWRSLDAVLTQNPPGVGFAANRPERSEDIEAAETAEGFWQVFDQSVPGGAVKRAQKRISYMMGMSGRVMSWTHTVTSSARFGRNDDGSPKSMEAVDIYGTLESKTSIACKSWDQAWGCFLFDDKDVLTLRAENEWIRSKISPGEATIGENAWERYARLGIRQAKKGYFLTGLALNNLTTEMNCFLRPDVFQDDEFSDEYPGGSDDEESRDGAYTYRDQFLKYYPDGCHVRYVGKEYAESWNESPDDAIDVAFPSERNGLTGGALMEPMRVVQDAFNDYMNAKRENYETGWSVTYFRGSSEDYAAISDQRSRPNDYILLKEGGPPDQKIEGQVIYREPPAESPAGFDEAIEELRGVISQDITGALPALQGTSNKETTATQQAMDRTQAMGMLGPAWANIQTMFAGIAEKVCLLASENADHGSEIVITGGDGKNISVKLEKLKKGKFHAHVSDSSFPETTAAKRANLTDLMKLAAGSPIGSSLLESPDNWEEFLELNGNPDLVLTPALAYKKQSRELEILLREPPSIPTPEDIAQYTVQHAQQSIQAEAQGLPAPPFQPPQPQPSLMPEADDYHQWESAKCQEYLSSEDCWLRQNIAPQGDSPEEAQEALQRAQLGVQNVRLHKAVHDQFLAQQAMQKAQMQQVMKPPSESINYKDEDPAGRQAMNAQAGIHTQAAPEANPQVQKNAAEPGTKGTGTV